MAWKLFLMVISHVVYLFFMIIVLILNMHLVQSTKPILKPLWLNGLCNLIPNFMEIGPGGGVRLQNHPQCSLLLESYSLYLLLI